MKNLYLLLTNEDQMCKILPILIVILLILFIFFLIKCLPNKENTRNSHINKHYSPKP